MIDVAAAVLIYTQASFRQPSNPSCSFPLYCFNLQLLFFTVVNEIYLSIYKRSVY